jgi:hypothetical protein
VLRKEVSSMQDKQERAEKKAYRRPTLVEYGRMADLTRGLFGRMPDCTTFFNTNSAPQLVCDARSS